MSRMQRSKGKAGESQVVHLARANGFPEAARDWATPQRNGDLSGIPNTYIECRRRETISIVAWCKEAEEAAGDKLPIVAFRRNNDQWRAALPLDKLFALLANQKEEE